MEFNLLGEFSRSKKDLLIQLLELTVRRPNLFKLSAIEERDRDDLLEEFKEWQLK